MHVLAIEMLFRIVDHTPVSNIEKRRVEINFESSNVSILRAHSLRE